MPDVQVTGPAVDGQDEVLTADALQFVARLQREFGPRRDELLQHRAQRRDQVAAGARLDFLPETAEVRSAKWQVAPAPADFTDRRVEITGPTEAKMAINALNSGARVWLADLEDANTPHWHNVVGGQVNLAAAVRRSLALDVPGGKSYRLATDRRLATIVVRPRGWHLDEKHLLVDGNRTVGALVDFGLYFFHNARALLESGSGPYFYLPKMESHLEARLWNDVFTFAEAELGIQHGSIRATVLIETIWAAFEMEEILYELREHAAGLNAGRWDYLFSVIKTFRDAGADFLLPDRAEIGMTAPMMRAYTDLLVTTCHRRGAFAMGGMAAFIPSRRDPEINERALAKVRDDKEREARDGFDGSWVAHPDLVGICLEAFDAALGDAPNQLHVQRDVSVSADQLLDVASVPGSITEQGLRSNVEVALLYLESWLRGLGAVAIHNLMEDAATAEISRSQVWQWLHNDVTLDTGRTVTAELIETVLAEELALIRESVGSDAFESGKFTEAAALFIRVATADQFEAFLTVPAYETLP
ncbi:MAG TPA: malate synthase A [Propionibacteriaceae bacterium]